MKNFASFCTTFLLHTLVEMLQNFHFSKMKFFCQKTLKSSHFWTVSVLILGQEDHCMIVIFIPPFFGSPFLSVFPSQNAKKWRSENSGSKGYPFGPFFLNHFWDIFSSVCYKKPDFQKSVICEIPDFRYPGFSVPGISQITVF